jgi:cytochrome b561
MPAWEASAAKWTHRLLYLCLVFQPMTGYLSSSFNKYGVKLFGLALPQWGREDKQLRELENTYSGK